MGYIKSPALSDKALAVLYALFFRGALQSGDIPSKAGANEMREAGLAQTQHKATAFGGEDHFTYLTAAGQQFAIDYLANTRFGVAQKSDGNDSRTINLKIAVDTYDVQAALEAVDKQILKVLSGETFIKDAGIQSVAIEACNIQSKTDDIGKQYAAAFGINVEGDKKVGFLADRFEVTVNAQNASETELQQAINKAVTDAISNAVKPGGLLYRVFGR